MFKKLRERLRKKRTMKATIKELNKLNDRELRDIGITRGNINEVATSIIEFHRTVRDGKSD